MQVRTRACGNTAVIASGKPFSPSTTAMTMSSAPRFLSSVITRSRNFAPSVRSIHKPEALLPAAYALAREIADNTAPVSVALNRHMIWKMLGADHPMEAHKVDSKGIYARGKSADVKEGVVAFLEKRPARFPMKVSDGMPSYFPWWQERTFK